MNPPPRPPRGLRIGLAAVAWFNLVSAVVGMVGLTIGGGMGLPPEWIEDTAFSSYVWPGILLGVVVGGVQLIALVAQYRGLRLAWGLHTAAGLVMLIWIFVELAVLLEWSPLHAVFFASGLVQTVLAILALGAWPSPFLQRNGEPSAERRP